MSVVSQVKVNTREYDKILYVFPVRVVHCTLGSEVFNSYGAEVSCGRSVRLPFMRYERSSCWDFQSPKAPSFLNQSS